MSKNGKHIYEYEIDVENDVGPAGVLRMIKPNSKVLEPADVQEALQRNRFSHVFQVVSRSVPKDRARNNIYLMNQSVEAPDAATEQYWTRTMSRLPVADHVDVQSTIGT